MASSTPAGRGALSKTLAVVSATTASSSPFLLPKCHGIEPRLIPARSAISTKVVLRKPCSANSSAAAETSMRRLWTLVCARLVGGTSRVTGHSLCRQTQGWPGCQALFRVNLPTREKRRPHVQIGDLLRRHRARIGRQHHHVGVLADLQ